MGRTVLIDSGPLIAALRRKDQFHAWAREHFAAQVEPFVTCEAVISESLFLLEKTREGKHALCGLLERGIITVHFSFQEQVSRTLELIRQYNDLPMSFADACLVRMSELVHGSIVFTTDSDFRTYRKAGRHAIPLLFPD